jgi:GT2 family glycosyltransferase
MANKLSVFYIARNEQDYISKSIESVKEIADEIIVIDCGSIDRTIEMCKVYKAKIFRYKWNDDFSEARNFALSKCTCDYAMCLDADEIIPSADVAKISAILKRAKGNSAYSFTIKDTMGKFGEDAKFLTKAYSRSPQIRLFTNDKSVKFKGRSYDSVDDSIYNNNSFSVHSSGVSIIHHLFRGNVNGNRKKLENYYAAINKEKPNPSPVESASLMVGSDDKDERKKCAIVMVVHNVLHLTRKCVETIRSSTSYPYKIYIVDSGSNEKTNSYLKLIEGVELITLPSNVGVAVGRNAGVKAALKDKDNGYVCLLDNDVEVYSGWLGVLVDFLDKNKNCAMVGPITNSAIGPQNAVKMSWVGKHDHGTIVSKVKRSESDNHKIVNHLNRFCQVIRTDLIKDIGFLDESFGVLGFEEHDYCKRISDAGHKIAVNKNVFVYHHGHATCTFNGMNYHLMLQDSSKKFHKKWTMPARPPIESVNREAVKNDLSTSIIVLTYNNLAINKRFYKAITDNTSNYELIVVDNGSSDGTIEYFKSKKNIKLIENGKNLGVIKARNIGMQASAHDYIVCLDNDQIVRKNWLSELHKEMEMGNDFVGVEAWELRNYSPVIMHSRKTSNIKIDYVGAGGCLMKRSVLEDIGLYDERFGMAYYEDVDICFRAKKAGYKVGWCDKKIINHLQHQTLIHGQGDFKYGDELANSHRVFVNKVGRVDKGEKFEEIKLEKRVIEVPKNKLLTFCMCLKNRKDHAMKSIRSLVTPENIRYFNFIICEDLSEDLLDLSDFEYAEHITHYVINTGDTWNRSKTLNYGFKRAKTPYISSWDADFQFGKDFAKSITADIKKTNFNNNFIRAKCIESDDSIRCGKLIKKGAIYGGMYIYKTEVLQSLRGYDETFQLWGWEEVDFNFRMEKIHRIKPADAATKVIHVSHDDDIRGSLENIKSNRHKALNRNDADLKVVNNSGWGAEPFFSSRVSSGDGYFEFMKGKRVAIVGPAPNVIGSKQGKKIDSYDIVIRVNKFLFSDNRHEDDLGSRTDILYNCLNRDPENGGPITIGMMTDNNVQWVCCPYPEIAPFDRDVVTFKNLNKGKVPFHVIDEEYYVDVSNQMGTRPNTGIVAILDILNQHVKELYITGFTFFQGGYYKDYRPLNEKQVMGRMDAHKNHSQEPQRKFIKYVYEHDKRVTVDKDLEKILRKK